MPLVSGVMGFYHFPSTRIISGGFTFVGESKAPFISKFVEFYTVSVILSRYFADICSSTEAGRGRLGTW